MIASGFFGIITCICFLLSFSLFSSIFFFFAFFIAALFFGQLLEIAKWKSLQFIHLIGRCIQAFSLGIEQPVIGHLCLLASWFPAHI